MDHFKVTFTRRKVSLGVVEAISESMMRFFVFIGITMSEYVYTMKKTTGRMSKEFYLSDSRV